MPVVDTPYDLNNSTRLSRNVNQVRLDCCSAVTDGGAAVGTGQMTCSVTEPVSILPTTSNLYYHLQAGSACSMLSSGK